MPKGSIRNPGTTDTMIARHKARFKKRDQARAKAANEWDEYRGATKPARKLARDVRKDPGSRNK